MRRQQKREGNGRYKGERRRRYLIKDGLRKGRGMGCHSLMKVCIGLWKVKKKKIRERFLISSTWVHLRISQEAMETLPAKKHVVIWTSFYIYFHEVHGCYPPIHPWLPHLNFSTSEIKNKMRKIDIRLSTFGGFPGCARGRAYLC